MKTTTETWKKYIDYMVLNKFKDTRWLKPVVLYEDTPLEIEAHISYTEKEFEEKINKDEEFKNRWID